MGILSLSYPMEVLQVCDNQRVSSDKQKPDLVSKLIRCAAILPRKMASTIEKHTRAHRLGLPNPWLDNANIKVFKEPVKVNARLLCHPSVQYQSENCALRDRCSWRFSDRTRYILPARCKSWVATYIHNGNGNGNDHIARQNIVEMLKEFMRQLVQLANSHGMDVSPPLRFGYVSNMLEMQECIQAMKKDNVEFAFFLTDDQIEDMHAFMKLLELQNDIVTQDLRLSTMENVVKNRKRITLENVILKMNVKLGGLNHNITINNPQFHNLLDPHTLFIGFGIDHPVFGMIHLPLPGEDKTDENGSSEDSNGENGNGSHEKGKKKDKETSQKPKTLGLELAPPTVVGVAANDGKHPFEFTGDYVFQTPSRDEKVMLIQRGDDDRLLLQDIIETIIERFQKNRGYLPSRVVVYRNGCSEGQYANVLSHEIPLIKHAMVRMKCGDAPLTFIVPNKMNNIRLIPEKIDPSVQKTAPEQNIKPGYVIDTKVVHPLWREFYLCSHTTIQVSSTVQSVQA
uniref:Piwi domain-containing protein n=1 Tax=Acrobeloides nanus TaxID=290746 RepID=A0A914EJ68_9BILA